VLHGQLDVLLAIRLPPQACSRSGHAGVGAREVWIELDSLGKGLQGLLRLPGKLLLHTNVVQVYDLQGCDGKWSGGGELHRRRRGVAQCLTNRSSELRYVQQ